MVPLSTATLTFNTAHNDGFGLDDATAATVAPIPLPAGGLLLLGGLVGFAALRRRGSARRLDATGPSPDVDGDLPEVGGPHRRQSSVPDASPLGGKPL